MDEKKNNLNRLLSLIYFVKEITMEEATWKYNVIEDTLYVITDYENKNLYQKISAKLSDNDKKLTIIDETEKYDNSCKENNNNNYWRIINTQNFYEFAVRENELIASKCTLRQTIKKNGSDSLVNKIKYFSTISNLYEEYTKNHNLNIENLYVKVLENKLPVGFSLVDIGKEPKEKPKVKSL